MLGRDPHQNLGQVCRKSQSQEWTNALNEMLSHPAIGKCNDYHAIHKLLAQADVGYCEGLNFVLCYEHPHAQVAYETGYYSTVYQPRDGGALAHLHFLFKNLSETKIWIGH